MVDTGTYNKLTAIEQHEFKKHSSNFIRAVQNSGATDGVEFEENHSIKSSNDYWFISELSSSEPFADIKTKSKAVIEALLTDAVQNYGR